MPGQHNNTFERFGRYGSPTGLAKQGKVNLIRTIVTEREISDEHKARLEHALHRGVTNAKADEIIVGSRGMRALGTAMLGSVASSVVHDAKVPVVVVR